MKYRLISNDTIKNLIDFLDEIQFDAAKENTTEAHHQVNFCNWAINELLNSYNVMATKDFRKSKDDSKPHNKKSRDQFVDETFMDWELPDMSDEEFEKLVSQFDNFLRGWEKEYNKKNPEKENIKERKEKEFKPRFGDVAEYCSLEEIRDMLLDDPELTDEERFELYYQEWERVKNEEEGFTLEEMLKDLNIKLPSKDEKN